MRGDHLVLPVSLRHCTQQKNFYDKEKKINFQISFRILNVFFYSNLMTNLTTNCVTQKLDSKSTQICIFEDVILFLILRLLLRNDYHIDKNYVNKRVSSSHTRSNNIYVPTFFFFRTCLIHFF